jgi:flagellar biosynthesis protein FlhF
MQVRKYEASTIKEAVDMVKKDLGPDAIILSTKEAQKGQRRVMITAAVTEETYQKKRMVEENLTSKQRDMLMNKPVRVQRQFIEQAFSNLKENIEEKRRQLESRNYATIPDEDFYEDEIPRAPQKVKKQQEAYAQQARRPAPPVEAPAAPSTSSRAEKRVKDAVAEAFKMGKEFASPSKVAQAKASMARAAATPAPAPTKDHSKIEELKSEIQRLQAMVQTMKSKNGLSAPMPVASHTGAKYGLGLEMAAMFERLLNEGFEERLVAELLKNAQSQLQENARKKGLLDAYVGKWVYSNTEIVKEKLQNRYHVFVGPRGVGKTSSLVKMASHLVIKERKKVAILSCDNNKVGAAEQLRIYAQILNVPFAVVRRGEDIQGYLQQMGHIDHVLIDTEGQSLLQMQEIENLKAVIPYHLGNIRIHLVMSALLKDDELASVGRRFKSVNYHDIIMTNIDQVSKHGSMVMLQQQLRSPYYAFATGPMIPEDFEWASKERVLDLIFKISKQKREGE